MITAFRVAAARRAGARQWCLVGLATALIRGFSPDGAGRWLERHGKAVVLGWCLRRAPRRRPLRCLAVRRLLGAGGWLATGGTSLRDLHAGDPGLLTFTADREYGSQVGLGRGAGRRRRADVSGDLRRDLGADLCPRGWAQGWVPPQVTARGGRRLIGQPGKLEMLGPVKQRWRDEGEHRREVWPRGRTLLYDECAGEQIAQALALRRRH